MARTTRDEARARIIEAAWTALDDEDVEQVLAGVSIREVARRAGVTASTITYHFPERAQLARAMVDHQLAQEQLVGVEVMTELLDSVPTPRDALRLAVDTNWEVNLSDDRRRFELRLMRLVAAAGSNEGGPELRRDLAERYYESYLPGLEFLWEAAVRRSGAGWVDPFTSRDLAMAMSAMIEGLVHVELMRAGTVRPGLASDIVIALMSAVARREDAVVGLAEREISIPVPRRADEVGDPAPGEDLIEVAQQASPLFQQRFEEVTWTEVARAVDRPVPDLAAAFGTVRRLAACGFRAHVPAVEEAAVRRAGAGAEVALVDLLCELARSARIRPGVARALLAERIDGAAGAATGSGRSWPIAAVVPLDDAVRSVLDGLPGVPPGDAEHLGPTLVDLTLGRAVAHPREAPARVAALAARLVDGHGRDDAD